MKTHQLLYQNRKKIPKKYVYYVNANSTKSI